MKLEVLTEHFQVPKKTQFGTIMKSLGQDRVFLKNEAGAWRQVGYLIHNSMTFLGLVDFPKELGPLVAAELAKQKKKPVSYGGAPESVKEELESEDENELS